MRTAKVHLYADDTIIYSVASSLTQAVNESQTAVQQQQALLYHLKLVLNAKKNPLRAHDLFQSSHPDLR